MTYTEGTAKALAELIHQIRPAWDRPGILAAIHQATAKRDLVTVAHIAIDAACDQTVRTPAVIATRDRQTSIQNMTAPTPADRRLCQRCRQIHTPDQNGCHRPAPAPDEALTQARQAITDARMAYAQTKAEQASA